MELILPLPTDNDWNYLSKDLPLGTLTGVPNWTIMTFAEIIITETANSSVKLNGFRINGLDSFTLRNVQPTSSIVNYRAANEKPTSFMQKLSQAFSFSWYVDYERDIWFFGENNIPSPFNIDTTSNNFSVLKVDVDTTQLGNRIIINGGEINQNTPYSQVIQGDGIVREWPLANKFDPTTMQVILDNNTDSHVAAVGTTTTNIKIVAHGLITGQWITNRTRSNAARIITKVDADNFTVQTVTAQTNGDTITFFTVSQSVGIAGLVDESTVNYLANSDGQSVRASQQTAVLPATTFIEFHYIPKQPIQIRYGDGASIAALKLLGIGDGVFDLTPIADTSIVDDTTALLLAQANVNTYKNPIITASFQTDQNGLAPGQLINITDAYRGLNQTFIIQVVRWTQVSGATNDYFLYDITCGSTLFGIVEFFMKMIRLQYQLLGDTSNTIIEQFADADEDLLFSLSEMAAIEGFMLATTNETLHMVESSAGYITAIGGWHWEASIGQVLPTRWNLFSWA